jgi:hypothetical protein
MNALYSQAAQLLIDWSGEDVGRRTSPRQISKEIVDMVVRELHENGHPALDEAAAHDVAYSD